MIFDLEYVRSYMNELDEITGFNSKDIELSVSNRMTDTYAYNQMKYNDDNKLVNWRQRYSEAILNCDIAEAQFKEIIRHEYCHAWADYGTKNGYGHSGEFKNKCKKLYCDYRSTNNDDDISEKFYKYVEEHIKSKRTKEKKVNYSKEYFDVITRGLKYNTEVGKRISVMEGKNLFDVNIIIYNKYPNCKDLDFMFNQQCEDVINKLKESDEVEILNYSLDKRLKDRMHINYTHRKGVIG